MNTFLPALVCRQYRSSRIVAFSTGAVYGLAAAAEGGSRETDAPRPDGRIRHELSRAARAHVPVFQPDAHDPDRIGPPFFYACELRYGVLVDLAARFLPGEPIDFCGWVAST